MPMTSEKVIEKVAAWIGRDKRRAIDGAELMREILELDTEPEWVSLHETARRLNCSESYLYHSWKKLGGQKQGGRIVFRYDFGLKRKPAPQ